MASPNTCQFCLSPFKTNSVSSYNFIPASHIWKYHFHQNVRESTTTSVCNPALTDKSEEAKLNFSLIIGQTQNSENTTYLSVCECCSKQLQILDKLHEGLQAAKKKVDDQVRKLKDIRNRAETVDSVNLCQNSNIPVGNMALRGTVVGKENILETLKFFGFLCSGIQTENPALNSEPEATTSTRQSNIVTDSARRDRLANGDTTDIPMDEVGPFVVKQEISEAEPLQPPEADGLSTEPTNHSTRDLSASQISPSSSSAKTHADILTIKPIVRDIVCPPPTTKKMTRRSCPECGKLVGMGGFNAHMKTHRSSDKSESKSQSLLKCQHCSKEFHSRQHLIDHEQTHSTVTTFTCVECNLTFSCSKKFILHRRIHEKVEERKRHMKTKHNVDT